MRLVSGEAEGNGQDSKILKSPPPSTPVSRVLYTHYTMLIQCSILQMLSAMHAADRAILPGLDIAKLMRQPHAAKLALRHLLLHGMQIREQVRICLVVSGRLWLRLGHQV